MFFFITLINTLDLKYLSIKIIKLHLKLLIEKFTYFIKFFASKFIAEKS